LSAIEEAEGYEVLRKQGMSAGQIADSVNKSKAYIHAKLKLLELCPEGRDKLRAGELSESVALLVARVPASLQAPRRGPRLRNRLLRESSVRPNRGQTSCSTTSRRTSATHGSPQDDEILVADAGPCNTCPKRLGNQTNDEDDADVCTDPICFELKQTTHKDRLRAEAIKSGQKIISGAEAKAIKPTARVKVVVASVMQPTVEYSRQANASL
jgi:hypothetical protein